MADDFEPTGLGPTAVSEFPTVSEADLEKPALDRLAPGSDLHAKVLEYLKDRLKMSEDRMSQLYPRWEANEMVLQAYVLLPNYEDRNKASLKDKEPPKPATLVIPYAYATVMTMATYMLHVFCGRKPMFQVTSTKSETTESAENMETVLQYNADHNKMVQKLWQYFLDGQTYGLSVMRTTWRNETAMRTIWKTQPAPPPMPGMEPPPPQKTKSRERTLVYSGNLVENVDPFMFFPDPRVPMHSVNRKGEFCFWRSFEGKHTLKTMEADGMVKWVDAAGSLPAGNGANANQSARNITLSGASATPGVNKSSGKVADFIQIDQGTCTIIPKELGLGIETKPQKWIFAIMNKTQICQAQVFDLDHDQHPVAVSEPYSVGYGFGQPGAVDYITPMQEILSWLVNSHIANVRASLNNMFVVDPSKVEMGDVKDSKPGKIIRLKPAAYGQDVRTIIQQLQVADVTQGHVRDFEMFMKLADSLTGVTDNIRGLQDSGGRKTATEVRTASEAGASRLAAQAMVISAQGVSDLTMQMCLNVQQFMEDSIYLQVVGKDGMANPIQIAPEMLVGDFQYPVNDGTLPIDRVAMLDVWKEILMGVAQNPLLAQRFDIGKIFEYVAQLGGAKNIKQFEVQIAPPGAGMPPGAVPVPMSHGGPPNLQNPGSAAPTTPGLTDASARIAQ